MNRSFISYCCAFVLIFWLFPGNLPAPTPPDDLDHATDGIYADLVTQLIKEGYNSDYVRYLYNSGDDVFYYRLTKINLVQREREDHYRRMFNNEAKRSIRDFIITHKTQFDKVEEKYGVDSEVIASILYVESRFGQVAGVNPVLYVLSSMTLAPADWNIEQLVEELDELFPDISDGEREDKISWLKSRARRKANWAYSELKTLLDLQKTHQIDVKNLRGSWAGAFGMPQFMPTSFEAYAVDGDENGKIDLYTTTDAIASVANYLYRNGWRGTVTEQKKRKTVWRYNHSNYYVDLIMDLAEATKIN